MAERFYSVHPDETVFLGYNAVQHQQQQQQQQHQQQQLQLSHHQHQQHLANAMAQPGAGVAGHIAAGGELDYLQGSAYFAAGAAAAAALDLSSGRSAELRYFGSSSVGHYNKMPPSLGAGNMMAKYGSGTTGGYLQPSGLMGAGPGSAPQPQPQPPGLPVPQHVGAAGCLYSHSSGNASCYTRNRYTPYNHNRACAAAAAAANSAAINTAAMNFSYQQPQQQQQQQHQQQQQFAPIYQSGPSAAAAAAAAAVVSTQQNAAAAAAAYERAVASAVQSGAAELSYAHAVVSAPAAGGVCKGSANGAAGPGAAVGSVASAAGGGSIVTSTPFGGGPQPYATAADPSQTVTLQITNLDYSMDEASLRNFLLSQLKPITPVVALVFEGSSYAKVTVPDLYFAKQVVSYLHRKKIGHKRMLVSYTRDSSLTEINTLRCQVAGLLKDVPYYTLPMYKFRELFQSRFKTSISVLDLYKMQDICSITADNNEERFISLQPELVNSLESSPLMEGLQHSVPYCTVHFKREQHKGWAEQDIEPLPNVSMTIAEIQQIIHPLLKSHPGDIPVASLVHCIEGELHTQITPDEGGVNLEHLVCCVQGIQIQMNNFGIKILGWLEVDKEGGAGAGASAGGGSQERTIYSKNSSVSDPLYQISREVVELVKMSPKSTMKFNRFIPAYHNHFGKQCRVADYGYTKLIELFEALSSVVQIMGDGENRQITLTHRTQIRRFTSDLLRILRTHGNKSVLLSELPVIFSQTQNRSFDVTDYGVCDIVDILDGLVNSNIVVVTTVQNGQDILISIPKRKQTSVEVEKTCIFAGEMVELFRNAPQYTILFQKFVRSYHYHFAYQCRLSDYGFMKLADLMDAIHGVVEMEFANDEDKKVFLSPKVARRVFAEQCEELVRGVTGSAQTQMRLEEVLKLHKKKYGYQMQAQTLGVAEILEAVELAPYVEVVQVDGGTSIVCHSDDAAFRSQCYRACKILLAHEADAPTGEAGAKGEAAAAAASAAKAPLTLAQLLERFNKKHKDAITEDTVKAMKHAIEIVPAKAKEPAHLRITKFMKFLMNVVRLLEQRPTMLLHEIKNAIDCGVSTCFEFGYPNLYTVLTAFPDIFAVALGVSQERSEVSLAPGTELRLSSYANHQHLFGSLRLPSAKQKLSRPARQPLGDYNARNSGLQGPPAKTRAVCSDSGYGGGSASGCSYKNVSYNSYYSQPVKTSSYAQQQQQQQQQLSSSVKMPPTFNPGSNNTSGSSIYSTASHHSSLMNTSASASMSASSSAANLSANKENSFSSSLNMFNASFNSSSTSFSDLNSSLGNVSGSSQAAAGAYPSAKLWDRRHSSFYQGQPLASAAAVAAMGSLPPLVMPAPAAVAASQQLALAQQKPPDQTTLYELVSNIQMCPMYEPPKPDTPPSDNMPFWIDPIWTNASEAKVTKNETLNIKLPEIKTFNVLPMLLSPYTLSKTENMKQQVFNFDSHDRKIA